MIFIKKNSEHTKFCVKKDKKEKEKKNTEHTRMYALLRVSLTHIIHSRGQRYVVPLAIKKKY